MVSEMLSSRNIFILKKNFMVQPRNHNLCLMDLWNQLKGGREVKGACSLHYYWLLHRFEFSVGVMIFLAIFRKFPNFKGTLTLWAKFGDRGAFSIQKFYLRATPTYKPHSRTPACSMWKLSLKTGFLWSKFRWNWGRGFES